MIVYEVNLEINPEIEGKFRTWLERHIRDMLDFPGFLKAQWLDEIPDEPTSFHHWTIQYYLKDRASLDSYLTHHASSMREEGLRLFGDQFDAQRRIFQFHGEFDPQ